MWATHPHTLPHSSPRIQTLLLTFQGEGDVAPSEECEDVYARLKEKGINVSMDTIKRSVGCHAISWHLSSLFLSSYRAHLVSVAVFYIRFLLYICHARCSWHVLLTGKSVLAFLYVFVSVAVLFLLFIRFLFVPLAHPKRPSDPCMTALSPLWPVWVLYDRFEPSTTGLSPVWPVWALYDRFESCMTGLRGHAASLVRSRSIGEQNNRLNESNSNHDAKSNSCCT